MDEKQPVTPGPKAQIPGWDDAGKPTPFWRSPLWIIAILVLAYAWFSHGGSSQTEQLAYSAFKAKVQNDEVATVSFRGHHVTGTLRAPTPPKEKSGAGKKKASETKEEERFSSELPPFDDPELLPLLEKNGVVIKAQSTKSSPWAYILISFLPWVLILGLILYSTRKVGRSMMESGPAASIFKFGQSKAKRFRRDESQVRFEDVAGLESAKRDLVEIIEYLKAPERFQRLGARIPKGVLLMGPPGTGKTLMARAVAGEADAPFYSISGSEFIEMFVGVGASRVRDMFHSAKAEAPAVIFIDEIDSVGRTRGSGLGGGHDEREQTLNQILSEMDGFEAGQTVVVMAATNRPDVLDPALLRPGRFDRKIVLDLPRREARRKILEVHARKIPLAPDVDLKDLAARTVGFSGADLENLLNEGALLAGREERESVDQASLEKAREKIVMGAENDAILSPEEKERVAYHESGHALAALLLPHTDPLSKVTIVPHGQALGVTEQVAEDDRYNLSESYLRDRIGVMLGGRVAEKIRFHECSSGAESDLKQATRLARRMVSQWGMSEKLGPVALQRSEEHIFLGREMARQRDFSEHTARLIDEEVRALLTDLEAEVVELLTTQERALRAVAEQLLEKETLDAEEIHHLVYPEYGHAAAG